MKLELESVALTTPQEKLLLRFLDRVQPKYESGKLLIEKQTSDLFKMVFTGEDGQVFTAVENTFNKSLNLLLKFMKV